MDYSTDQICALAPDESSVKAAKKLLQPGKWPLLAAGDSAVWGHCQGSGSKPYRVMIDLSEPAFKCSCPSRKFPCKHGLALLLMYAESRSTFERVDDLPDEISDWLAARQTRTEKQANRAAAKAARETDPEQKAKREAKRHTNIADGLQEFELWLCDLIRQGLAPAQARDRDYWETPAKRLVDAQAGRLAALVERMRDTAHCTDENWPVRLFALAGKAMLLIEGFSRMEALAPETQTDIRTALGWHQDKDSVLTEGACVSGTWNVLGTTLFENTGIREQRTWLQHTESAQSALILDFAHGSQPLDISLTPGTAIEAELTFYPGAASLRALVKSRKGKPAPLQSISGCTSIEEALTDLAETIGKNPWTGRLPLALNAVVPMQDGNRWFLRDGHGGGIPVSPHDGCEWEMLAISGGHPIAVFGEWYEQTLTPLCCWSDGGYRRFPYEETARN